MRRILFFSVSMVAIYAVCGLASATTIADYNGDFTAGTPAAGWSYMWNPAGVAIGDSAHYANLTQLSVQNPNYYATAVSPNPSGWLPNLEPGTWLYTTSNSLIPGVGSLDSSDGNDHYVILGYEIQSSEAGQVSIIDSTITNAAAGNANLRVYVGDTLKYEVTGIGGQTTTKSFDGALGTLTAGQIVYVAVGPDSRDWNDYISPFNFKLISTIPEPGMLILFTTGLVGLLAYAWRKRR